MSTPALLDDERLAWLTFLPETELLKVFNNVSVPAHVTFDVWRGCLFDEHSRRSSYATYRDVVKAMDYEALFAVDSATVGMFEQYSDAFPSRSHELHTSLEKVEEALCHIEVTSARGRLPVVSGTGFAFGFNNGCLFILTNQHIVENDAALLESSFHFRDVVIPSCVQLVFDGRSAFKFNVSSHKLDFVIISIPQNTWLLALMPSVPHASSGSTSLFIPTIDSNDHSKCKKYRANSWFVEEGFVKMDKNSVPLNYGHSGGPALLVYDTEPISSSLYGMILGCNDSHLLLVPFDSIGELLNTVAQKINFQTSEKGYITVDGFKLSRLKPAWSAVGPSVLYGQGPKYVLAEPMRWCNVNSEDATSHKWIGAPFGADFNLRVLVTIPMLSQHNDQFNDTMLDSCLGSMREAIGERRDVVVVIGLNQWLCESPADSELSKWKQRQDEWAGVIPVLLVRFHWKTHAKTDADRYSQKNMPCGRFRTQILIHDEVKKLLGRLNDNEGYIHIGDADIESGYCLGNTEKIGTPLFEQFYKDRTCPRKTYPDIVIGGYTFGTKHTLPAALVTKMPTVNSVNCRESSLQSAVGVQNSFLDLRMRTYLQRWHKNLSSKGNAYPTEPNLFVHTSVINQILSTIGDKNLDWLFGPTQLEGQFFLNRYRMMCTDFEKEPSIQWQPHLAIVTEGRPVCKDEIKAGLLPLQRLLGAAAQSYADPRTFISEMLPEEYSFRTSAGKKMISFTRPGLDIDVKEIAEIRQQLTQLSQRKVLQINDNGLQFSTDWQLAEETKTKSTEKFLPASALAVYLDKLRELNLNPTETASK